MQEFLYHMVPKELIGDKLIPLNSIKKTYPNLYDEYTKKYFNHPERPNLLKREIPKLNCLWNDVVHFLPLHPYHVYKALKSLEIKIREEQAFFKIPIENLKLNKNAIYLYSKENYKGPAAEINLDQIKSLNIEDYTELKEIPSDTIEYYKAEKDKGKPFGLFPYIPHLLSLGEIDIKDVEIIIWNRFSDD